MKTSHAGSTSDFAERNSFTLKPTIAKTALKGVIGIAIFSLFLEVDPSNIVNYLIFLGIFGVLLAVVLFTKRSYSYEFADEALRVRRPFRRTNSISYRDIVDISVSQGFLARRFGCGTVYLMLGSGRGSVRVMGGGYGEQLEDVPDPDHVYEMISSRLDIFSSPTA